MSQNTCPFLEKSECPMKNCPYLKELKPEHTHEINDIKECPFKEGSNCPYFNGTTHDHNKCPLKTDCSIKNCTYLNEIKDCPYKKETNCPYLKELKEKQNN